VEHTNRINWLIEVRKAHQVSEIGGFRSHWRLLSQEQDILCRKCRNYTVKYFSKLTTHLHLEPRSRIRGAVPLLPNTPPGRGAQLKKHRDNFTFTLLQRLPQKKTPVYTRVISRAHTHAYVRTYVRTYIHTYIHTHVHTWIHAFT
jgi:hypothetical protein